MLPWGDGNINNFVDVATFSAEIWMGYNMTSKFQLQIIVQSFLQNDKRDYLA